MELALIRRTERPGDHRGRTRPGTVACFVFGLSERPHLRPQPSEVAAASWLPVTALVDPERSTSLRYAGIRFPGIAHEGQVIWGLTLKSLESFLAMLGRQRPSGRPDGRSSTGASGGSTG